MWAGWLNAESFAGCFCGSWMFDCLMLVKDWNARLVNRPEVFASLGWRLQERNGKKARLIDGREMLSD